MEKYYSSALSPTGLLCNFKIMCEKQPKSNFYIITNGTDFERSVFFDELQKLFSDYSSVTYCPFYDDGINGIYLKHFDTYILSSTFYSRVCPVSSEICETEIHLAKSVYICPEEKKLIAKHYVNEKEQYLNAVSNLSLAGICRENRNSLLSDYIIDDRMINALKRIIKKIPVNVKCGKPQVKLLSAVTPLGIHTIWNTVFDNYETVIELEDVQGFSSAVITGIVRDRLISENEEFILIPDMFYGSVPQMLLLPQSSTALIRTDSDHTLPFAPTYRSNMEKYISLPKHIKEKYDILLQAENRYVENAVSFVYEGRDERRKMNKLLLPRSCAENAKQQAREIYKKIVK